MSGKNKTVHLGERLFSSKAPSKLIEETPSPVLTEEQRTELLNKTVKMVEKLNYEGQVQLNLFMKMEIFIFRNEY